MGKRRKQTSSSSRDADKENYHQEKVDTVNAILLSSGDDNQTFWRPTEEEMGSIGLDNDDDESPAVSVETLNELEGQLNVIYHLVPQLSHLLRSFKCFRQLKSKTR